MPQVVMFFKIKPRLQNDFFLFAHFQKLIKSFELSNYFFLKRYDLKNKTYFFSSGSNFGAPKTDDTFGFVFSF